MVSANIIKHSNFILCGIIATCLLYIFFLHFGQIDSSTGTNIIPKPFGIDWEYLANFLRTKEVDPFLDGLEDDPRVVNLIKNWYLDDPTPKDVPYDFESKTPYANGQHGQQKLVDEYLKGKRNGFFIECGAFDGEIASNTIFFELERNWNGLLIEPNVENYFNVKRKQRKVSTLNACISGTNKMSRVEFLNARDVGGIVGQKSGPKVNAIRDHIKTISFKSKVTCFPFYSVLLAIGNPTIDYFSLDVEGFDWKIIQSIPWSKVNIQVLSVETTNFADPTVKQLLEDYMVKMGYMILAHIELDTIFVKKNITINV